MSKFNVGDCVTIQQTNYPVVLRDGPGYSYNYISIISPKEFGIILERKMGHGAITWIQLLVSNKKGWIPVSVLINVFEHNVY